MSIIDEKKILLARSRKRRDEELRDRSRAFEEEVKDECRKKIINVLTHDLDKYALGKKFVNDDGTITKSARVCFPTPSVTLPRRMFQMSSVIACCERVLSDPEIPIAINKYWEKYNVKCTKVAQNSAYGHKSIAYFNIEKNDP